MKVLRLAAIAAAFACTGCASIVSHSEWPVNISSTPDGATFEVVDESGQVVHRGTTPSMVTLDAHEAWFKGEDYTIRCSMPGRQGIASADTSLNGWYWGNILFGGVIGMLIVDPATGAMWRLPERVHVDLSAPAGAAN